MARRFMLRPRAEADLEDTARWYDDERFGLAERSSAMSIGRSTASATNTAVPHPSEAIASTTWTRACPLGPDIYTRLDVYDMECEGFSNQDACFFARLPASAPVACWSWRVDRAD
jgi:hypothetical protein